jgi:2-polyprenyl-3-methyl-5-hydroxy-6-metoxy-1,4-benzoquinol methylase
MKNQPSHCPFCSQSNVQLQLMAADYNKLDTVEKFAYYKCHSCGTTFLETIPENLQSYYEQSSYSAYATARSKRQLYKTNQFETSKVDLLKKWLTKGSVLEVGPGAGDFLTLAKNAGYSMCALEQSQECVNRILGEHKIPALCTTEPWKDIGSFGGQIDAVAMWHVIEHLSQLPEFLRKMADTLPANGLFFVSAPNPESWSFRVFKKYWVHLDAPRHLLLVPIKSLDDTMLGLGFQRVSLDFGGVLGRHLCAMAWQTSLVNKLRGNGLPELLVKVIGRLSHYLLTPIELLLGQGAAYTAVYRKVA